MNRVVADTGPVLHLHEAGALHLLPLLGEIFLPPLVIAELRNHAPELWPVIPPAWVKLQTLSAHSQQLALEWKRAGLLHGGEAEALALAGEIKSDWFLTDDAAARLNWRGAVGGDDKTFAKGGSRNVLERFGKIIALDVAQSPRGSEGGVGKNLERFQKFCGRRC